MSIQQIEMIKWGLINHKLSHKKNKGMPVVTILIRGVQFPGAFGATDLRVFPSMFIPWVSIVSIKFYLLPVTDATKPP